MPRVGRRIGSNGYSSSDGEHGGGKGGAGTNQVFEQYMSALDGDDTAKDDVFNRGLARVREYLSGTAGDGASACLICLGTIAPTEAVWSCRDSCFSTYHLPCIQEWARNQVEAAVLRTMNKLSQFPGAAAQARAEAEWGCPKCRCAYPSNKLPSAYTCFCGKVDDPEWDPWRAPHSCGDVCGRPLGGAAGAGGDAAQGGGCSHTCLLLCHPGPCPPCPLVVSTKCYCGRKSDRRRCGRHEFSCGGMCLRKLECGHPCAEKCHEGECPPCSRVGDYKCACGAETRHLTCGERRFQCTKVCGKTLACGQHTCELVCHAGPCGGCPFEGVRTCPCGKHTYPELSCLDKPPTCGMTCGKLLPCGQHRCQDRCHTGDCATCRATVTKECRCGKTTKEVLCSAELLCERRCTNMRACGRHPCKRRCCDGTSCPPCEESCGRKLRCGNHRCPAPCHSGPCRPCPLTVSYSCACAHMTATLPCGAESRALPPRCYRACPVPGVCRHTRAPAAPVPHRCHFGPCPPCGEACGTSLPCGHTCAFPSCHDPPVPAIALFTPPPAPKGALIMSDLDGAPMLGADSSSGAGSKQAAGGSKSRDQSKESKGAAGGAAGSSSQPAAPTPPALATAVEVQQLLFSGAIPNPPTPCPPCVVPVSVGCLGGHEQRSMACSTAAPYVCSRPCGSPLTCGNHTCDMPCHAKRGSGSPAAVPCEPCTRRCGAPRSCAHPCALPCHQGPCPACTAPQGVPCHCGKATVTLPCTQLQQVQATLAASGSATSSSALVALREAKQKLSCGKPCHKQLPHCPHPCREVCHSGPCPGITACSEEVTVRCECKRQKTKWTCMMVQAALAEAGRPSTYDDTTPLRLLQCDEACAAAGGGKAAGAASKAEPAAPKQQAAPKAAAAAAPAASKTAATADADGDGGKAGGSSRLSKAERIALAEKREAERRKAEEAAQRKAMIKWIVILVLGLVLGLAVPELFAVVDRWLRSKYGK